MQIPCNLSLSQRYWRLHGEAKLRRRRRRHGSTFDEQRARALCFWSKYHFISIRHVVARLGNFCKHHKTAPWSYITFKPVTTMHKNAWKYARRQKPTAAWLDKTLLHVKIQVKSRTLKCSKSRKDLEFEGQEFHSMLLLSSFCTRLVLSFSLLRKVQWPLLLSLYLQQQRCVWPWPKPFQSSMSFRQTLSTTLEHSCTERQTWSSNSFELFTTGLKIAQRMDNYHWPSALLLFKTTHM